MKTVQLSIRDSAYAESLRNTLLRDGTHRVYLVEQPDMRIEGVVVIDGSELDRFSACWNHPERLVAIVQKGTESLPGLWNTGVRHVVFEGDSPGIAQLAVIAAELRLRPPVTTIEKRLARRNCSQTNRLMDSRPNTPARI
jgi:hypothetical protein